MGLLQSRQSQAAAPPAPAAPAPTPGAAPTPGTTARPTTPPRPSASHLASQGTSTSNSNAGTSASILSYFLPLAKPDLTHTHLSPSIADIEVVSYYLTRKGLPIEIVAAILDQAGFWVGCRRQSTKNLTVHATDHRGHTRPASVPWSTGQEDELGLDLGAGPGAATSSLGDAGPGAGAGAGVESRGGGGPSNTRGNIWYLASSPIGCSSPDPPAGEGSTSALGSASKSRGSAGETGVPRIWVRQVVVETLSRDQGWSNTAGQYGTYEQSYSWFDIALLRNGAEVDGSRHSIQHNVHAGQYFKSHSNTLGPDHPTLKLAQPGDRIMLWARAQYPGWSNWVQEAAITIFTAPFPPQL